MRSCTTSTHPGDRYVGYDYATKKPLDDFLLDDQSSSSVPLQRPLITTLPVIGLLGRQDYVDAVYHDLTSDLVFVFTGMKFYSFPASEFKVSFSLSVLQLHICCTPANPSGISNLLSTGWFAKPELGSDRDHASPSVYQRALPIRLQLRSSL